MSWWEVFPKILNTKTANNLNESKINKQIDK